MDSTKELKALHDLRKHLANEEAVRTREVGEECKNMLQAEGAANAMGQLIAALEVAIAGSDKPLDGNVLMRKLQENAASLRCTFNQCKCNRDAKMGALHEIKLLTKYVDYLMNPKAKASFDVSMEEIDRQMDEALNDIREKVQS